MVFKFLSPVISFLILISLCAGLAQAERRGVISSGKCPYNCASQNVPKEFCREWNQGNTCFVEDSRPASGQMVSPRVSEPRNPSVPTPKGDTGPTKTFESWSGSGTEYQSEQERDYYECKKADYLGKPRINVHKVKQSGTSFKEKYRISGSVEGVCLVEAGYFEFGKKIEDIRVRPDRQFRRFDFDVIVKGDRAPEIRVYNINGDRDLYSIADDEYEHERDRNDSRWRR